MHRFFSRILIPTKDITFAEFLTPSPKETWVSPPRTTGTEYCFSYGALKLVVDTLSNMPPSRCCRCHFHLPKTEIRRTAYFVKCLNCSLRILASDICPSCFQEASNGELSYLFALMCEKCRNFEYCQFCYGKRGGEFSSCRNCRRFRYVCFSRQCRDGFEMSTCDTCRDVFCPKCWLKHNDPYGSHYCQLRLGIDDYDVIDTPKFTRRR